MMPMPDVTAQRAHLVQVLEQGLDQVRVFAAAPHQSLPAEFVLLGMPSWLPAVAAVGMDRVQWSVMVCVARPGTNDTLTALALEGLWPQVLQLLVDATESDPSMGGTCVTASVAGAEFTTATLQGKDFPAQLISLEMQGA